MQNVVEYPNFQPLKLGDNEWYTAFYDKFEPYASHSFGNVFSWFDLNENLVISRLNDNIVFAYTDFFNLQKSDVLSYSILGNTNAAQTLETFFAHTSEPGASLHAVQESFVTSLNTNFYNVAEDPNNNEYVLDVNAFAGLVGAQYAGLKLNFEHFLRSYGDKIELRVYDVSSQENQAFLLNFYKQWAANAKLGNTSEELETLAIQKRLGLGNVIKINCLAIHINGNIEGFLFYSYPPQHEYVQVHHIKCNYNLYDYMLFMAAQKFKKDNKKYMNIEQDFGEPELRAHKTALKPVKMLKKYNISR